MTEQQICDSCGDEFKRLTDGLCDKCYTQRNEGPCGCFKELERFK